MDEIDVAGMAEAGVAVITVPTENGPQLIPDRRRGPRRTADQAVNVERRGPDRRRRKPGVAALLGVVLAENVDADWVDAEAPERV